MTIVTADGEIYIVNMFQNQDLFWTLCGSGFGFGVVWSNKGWAGYGAIRRSGFMMEYLLPEAKITQASASLKPLMDYVRSYPGVQVVTDTLTSHKSFYSFFLKRGDAMFGERFSGINGLIGSRLIPHSMFQSKESLNTLAENMLQIQAGLASIWQETDYLTQFVGGGQVSKGTTPASSLIPACINRLYKITSGGGTYANEADPNEPDWQDNFYRTNYQRLLKIKHRFDPKGLFVCLRCVGSEDWDVDMMCPRR
ncbi:hypothetical protein FBU30_005974 [Linnemannia zychae]|nr:hypothetical protein FBU30_005974 [Linnemannia zychae]